jgi:chemotaxis signal transduction protein
MTALPPLSQAVLELRAQFDSGFAQAPQAAGAPGSNMLAIRAAGEPYALYLEQIGGLYADRSIVALPSAVPSLLGVTGFRGQIIPVYDLAVLLGHARGAAPRWLVLVRCAQPLALAFDQFESHFSAAPEHIMHAAAAPDRPHLCDTVQGADALRPIIHLPSLHDDIQRQAALALPQRSTST